MADNPKPNQWIDCRLEGAIDACGTLHISGAVDASAAVITVHGHRNTWENCRLTGGPVT